MKEGRRLVEYGVPIDPEVMVTPPEATELELEPIRRRFLPAANRPPFLEE